MPVVYCFSATGNSLYVAKRIAAALGGEVRSLSRPDAVCDEKVIGFVFPAYFWGLPNLVDRFLRDLPPPAKDAYLFAVTTYGGAAPGVLGAAGKRLREKGLRLSYGGKLKMPDNYLPAYTVKDSEAIRLRIDRELDALIEDVVHSKRKAVAAYTPLSRLVHRQFPAHQSDCDSHFTVSAACTRCGVCGRACPVGNIALPPEEGPRFAHRCELCLACLHACPAAALDWKTGTVGKARYRNPHITPQELIDLCAPKVAQGEPVS